ncbi:MAG: hypothetical protein LBM12_02550 [Candidatus Nomurabacteria bacterium]|jgi:hypothetical protein|nr:hypothetical protein [Candidatus Nomurabacteria bacterium]
MNDDIRLISEMSGDTYRNSAGKEVSVIKVTNDILMTTKEMAKFYGVSIPTINKKLKKLFNSGEMNEKEVSSILTQRADDGKLYRTTFYNLKVIEKIRELLGSQESLLK